MHTRDHDPATEQRLDIDTATDRRRTGRQDVNPELIPMLRGHFDHDAPADPDIPPPRLRSIAGETLGGATLLVALVLAGVLLRFAV